jgi:hypothetical protein
MNAQGNGQGNAVDSYKGFLHLLFAGIFLVATVIVIIQNFSTKWLPYHLLLGLLPVGILLAIRAMVRKPRVPFILKCVVYLLLGHLAFGWLAAFSLAAASSPLRSNEPTLYAMVRNHLWSCEGDALSFIPRHFPPEAENAQFYYRPALFQGSAELQLRCAMPESAIRKLEARFGEAGRLYEEKRRAERGDEPPLRQDFHLHNHDESGTRYSEDYRIIRLHESGYWNHGLLCGVAISTQRHEIVYWVEDW